MTACTVSLASILDASKRIAPYVDLTPVVTMTPSGLRIKAESLHRTGAFKVRGAFNTLLSLSDEQRLRGVVAHSSGNHAQALAFAARKLGVRATVVIPETAAPLKIEATRRWGARVILVSPHGNHRFDACDRVMREEGALMVPPYDSHSIMAATGTIALEVLEQVPDVECIVAPVAGGGLLGGLAAAIAQTRREVKVIGAEPALADDAAQSFRAGRIVEISPQQALRTSADGLRTACLGELTWPVIRDFVHDIVTVTEDQIRETVKTIFLESRLVAEPSGAVAVAAALSRGSDRGRTVAVLSGGNIAPGDFGGLLAF